MQRTPKNEKMCKEGRCLKETNHNAEEPEKRGFYLGIPFLFEEDWMACYFCRKEGRKL